MKLEQIELELRLLRVLVDGDQSHKMSIIRKVPTAAIINLKEVWEVVASRIVNHQPVDIDLIRLSTKKLTAVQKGFLESIGSVKLHKDEASIFELIEALLKDYRKIQLLQSVRPHLQAIGDGEIEAVECLEALVQACQTLSADFSGSDHQLGLGVGFSVEEIIREVFKEDEVLFPLGYTGFDTVVGGLAPGDLVVVAAPTSSGKTTFMMNTAMAAAGLGVPTAFYSLELTGSQVLRRCLARQSGLDFSILRNQKNWTEDIKEQISKFTKDWHKSLTKKKSKFLVKDNVMLNVTDLLSDASVGGYKFLVIDYINLMIKGEDEQLWQKLGECARQLKVLARSLGVVVMIAAQYDEKFQQIRYSRAIKEHCDIMLTWMLQDKEAKEHFFECVVEKGRNIPCFRFWLHAKFDTMLIEDCPENMKQMMEQQKPSETNDGSSSSVVQHYNETEESSTDPNVVHIEL